LTFLKSLSMKRYLRGIFAVFILLLPAFSSATSEYARQTGRQCGDCHIDVNGGGLLTDAGKKYRDELKIEGVYKPLTEVQKVVRLIVGYVHLMTAIMWFGTILYVHILLKPAYASKGLPRGELLLGWISMALISITGVFLTIARIPSWRAFYTTRFGILLSVKIALFLIMFLSAVIVTLFIGPRLRQRRNAERKTDGKYSAEELSHFDGREGRPAYVAYNGTLYDVTGSKLWKGGSHLKKHNAGNDLTELLKTAPHGEEKVLAMPVAGTLTVTAVKASRPFHERLFYFFAYMNLAFTFLIVFVIALWRWW
jgi:predicted heme/steroid binding protein